MIKKLTLFNLSLFSKVNRHKLSVACVALCLLSTPRANAQYDHFDQLPDLGSTAAKYLSEHDAITFGRAFIRQSRYQSNYISDPELVAYINKLGHNLAASSGDANRQFHFYLIANDAINAFAVPGGYIALHTAILTKSTSESELASVIAHEISHVTQRHFERRLEASRYDSFIALGALVAAAAAGGANGAQAAFGLANASIIDRQLNYSRSNEAEADSIGLRLLNKAGYSPSAMPAFFKRLLDENRLNTSHAPEFLLSHPLTLSRITETTQRAKSYPANNNSLDDSQFKLMQAKAIAGYSSNKQQALDLFKDKISKGDKSLATRYGYALALSKNAQYKEARTLFNQLLAQYPGNVSVRLAQADNELDADNINKGLSLLGAVYEEQVAKDNHIVDLYYANALVLTTKYKQAIPILRSAIANDRDEPFYHILLARSYGETGKRLLSYQARGEYHYLSGNYSFALKQFKHAKTLAKSDYEKALLEARIMDSKEQIEALKKTFG